MHRRGYTPNQSLNEDKPACSNCKRLVKKIEIMNEAFQRQLDKLTMERKIHKEEKSRMEEKVENLIQLNRKQEREIKDLEIKLQEKEEKIQQLLKNIKMAPQPKVMDPKEEARQRGLQQNFMEAVYVKVWSDLEKKQQLDVYRCGLLELPKKLCLLTQLKFLYLGGNQLSSLPANIGALKELQKLWLNGNQLPKLPQSLGDLRELTRLDLSSNQLTELPQSLGNLSKLQRLYIHNHSNLKELPMSFKNLKELNVLGIDWQLLPKQNIFKTEPFASLKNLQKLYIDNDNGNEQRRQTTKKEESQMKLQVYYRINGQWQ